MDEESRLGGKEVQADQEDWVAASPRGRPRPVAGVRKGISELLLGFAFLLLGLFTRLGEGFNQRFGSIRRGNAARHNLLGSHFLAI